MLAFTRNYSESKPPVVMNLQSGYWYYNYDIQTEEIEVPVEQEVDTENEESTESTLKKVTRYNFVQIRVAGKPEYKKCVEAIIREYISQSQEFDLINSANKAILAGNTSSNEVTEYQKYLSIVEEIKQKVEKDLGK